MSKEATLDLGLIAVILIVLYYLLDSFFKTASDAVNSATGAPLYNAATGQLNAAQIQAQIQAETANLIQAGMSQEAATAQATADVKTASANSPDCGTWLECDYNLLKAALETPIIIDGVPVG